MPSKKIAFLGAGSVYAPGVLADVAVTPELGGSDITLYDLDLEKAELVAKAGRRLAEQSGTGLSVRACRELGETLEGADFVVTSIGGSGASLGGVYGTAAHQADLLIPARYGIYQVVGDTAGPAGMMMGLRSIPVYLGICREMERRCPEGILLNHSNPMAVLCRAMTKYSRIQAIGICHGVQIGIGQLAHLLGVPAGELEVTWIGTNHYYWFTRIRRLGRDIYHDVMARMAAHDPEHGEQLCAELSAAYGYRLVYQEDGHALEFYPYLSRLPGPQSMPYGYDRHAGQYENPPAEPTPTPQEQAKQRRAGLEGFAAELDRRELPAGPETPERGEAVAALMAAIATGRREVRILNVANRHAVPNLPAHAVLELEAVTDSAGVRPLYVGEAPTSLMGLLQKRIAWQELVAEAGATGDRGLALQALLLDEMALPPEQCRQMLDELLAASRELLPQFRG